MATEHLNVASVTKFLFNVNYLSSQIWLVDIILESIALEATCDRLANVLGISN